jgi:2-keto-4-pentenoate hydratase/2-oxohepta-3-ene-1,7-dioic acid hydratase in catechol pathway
LKLVTYRHNGQTRVGAVQASGIVELASIAPDMLSLIDGGSKTLDRVRQRLQTEVPAIPLEQVALLAPIPSPRRNVMCLGLNYAEHAKESAEARGRDYKQHQHPVFFTKATHTINRPEGVIPFDAAVSTEIDWEAELGVIVGRTGRNIPIDAATDYVFGYTCINDVSARDLQANHSQFFKGKSLDGACPMGPWIVTSDEIPDPHNLRITCRVNGVTKQDSNTGSMISNIPTILSILSRGMTLDAGDIIATGTPSGVGFARKPPEFLRPGDVVEVEIERIGVLRNRVGE